MTVIAATAAAPSVSASSGVGGQGVDQGFDALLAAVTGDDRPAPAKSAPKQGLGKSAGKAADRAADGAVDKLDRADQVDTALTKASEAGDAGAAAVASGNAKDVTLNDDDAAAQADAAALAAATMVAAMIPQTEETFAAGALPEAEVVATTLARGDLVEPQVDADAVATPVETVLDAATVALDAASLGAPVSAQPPAPATAGAESAAVPTNVPATPVAELKVAVATATLAPTTVEVPEAAQLETPVAAEEAGIDVAALGVAQAVKAPTIAPNIAPVVAAPATNEPASTTPASASPGTAEPIIVAEVETPPVVVATLVEAAPAVAEAVQPAMPVVAQAAAEPALKAATAAVAMNEAEPAAPTEAEALKTANVQAASLADQADADQGGASQQGQGEPTAEALIAVATDTAAIPDAPTISQTTATPAASVAEVDPALRAEVRGSPETVAQLSAEILKKLDAKTTRFDVALTPDGLGKVDVRIEIGRNGALSASMAFDNAQAAAELRGKSQELRQALSQAGFTIADNALRFDVSSQGGQNGHNAFFHFNEGQDGRRAWSGKAFQSAQTDDAPILSASDLLPGLRMAPDSGLDIRI